MGGILNLGGRGGVPKIFGGPQIWGGSEGFPKMFWEFLGGIWGLPRGWKKEIFWGGVSASRDFWGFSRGFLK